MTQVVHKGRVETAYWPKPIPTDRFDWQATFQNYEPGDYVGHGATEGEAIADLLLNFARPAH